MIKKKHSRYEKKDPTSSTQRQCKHTPTHPLLPYRPPLVVFIDIITSHPPPYICHQTTAFSTHTKQSNREQTERQEKRVRRKKVKKDLYRAYPTCISKLPVSSSAGRRRMVTLFPRTCSDLCVYIGVDVFGVRGSSRDRSE